MGASSLVFPNNELERHIVTSTNGYWRARAAPPDQRAAIALKIADHCQRSGLTLQTLASLRVAVRLGADPAPISNRIAELDDAIERQKPVASVLPAEFSLVPHSSADYDAQIIAGGFSQTPVPFRNSDMAISAFRRNKGIQDHASQRLDFILLRKGVPVSRVVGSVDLDGGVTEYNNPVRIEFGLGAPPTGLFQISELTLDVLRLLALRHGACDIQLDDIGHGTMQTVVGRAAAVREYLPELRTAPYVDLTQDEKDIWSGVRDSYRPLIRSERKGMSLRHYGKGNPDRQAIDGWRSMIESCDDFDAGKLAHAVERADCGHGEIVAGFLEDGRCCAATAVFDDGPLTVYEVGNYIETTEWRKASHYPLYESILRARERGQSRFYLTYFGDPTARYAFDGGRVVQTPKSRAINFFMRGFSETIERKFVFRLVL